MARALQTRPEALNRRYSTLSLITSSHLGAGALRHNFSPRLYREIPFSIRMVLRTSTHGFEIAEIA